MPKFPDRWFDYSDMGAVIPGTRLLTFKVPLKQEFFANKEQIPEDARFTPGTLLDTISDRGLKLGLVIDLTFTDRYYNPEEFTSRGIQYHKIFVPGHVIPDQDIIDRFYEAIENFLSNSEEDILVGVHCTHGVNRTGYVVCRYMVEHLGMKATEALAAYGEARGYPVERENYIYDLKCRAGEIVEENDQGNKHAAKGHLHKTQRENWKGQHKGRHGQISEHQGEHKGHYGHASGYQVEHEGHHSQASRYEGQHEGCQGYPSRQWGQGMDWNQYDKYSASYYHQQHMPYYRNSHEKSYDSYTQPENVWGGQAYWNGNGHARGQGYAPRTQSSAGSDRSYSRQNSKPRIASRGHRGQGNFKHFSRGFSSKGETPRNRTTKGKV